MLSSSARKIKIISGTFERRQQNCLFMCLSENRSSVNLFFYVSIYETNQEFPGFLQDRKKM